ncbi:hypothetical protein [Aquamicrobium soli]|uniref:Uncharacterized protein n=1 Tax=Aquamicrobium soli TaxID=1811518 RepID=A0ABV7K918_9HYPH
MGHQHLLVLPRSKVWKQVVGLISGGANAEAIAGAVSEAAECSMIDASNDVGVQHAFWLLTQLPLAARGNEFSKQLTELGVKVGPDPTLIEITSAFMSAIDRHVELSRARSDFGEMAQLSAIEAIHVVVARELPGLFGVTGGEVKSAIAGLATVKQFAVLSREFFSRLTRRHLDYYLSRELSAHVGSDQRFTSLRDHAAFNDAITLHCAETSRIIKEFSGEWYSKQNYEGGIDPSKAGRFVNVAAKKIRAELRRRRGLDA